MISPTSSLTVSDRHWGDDQCAFFREQAPGALAFGDLVGDESGKFAIDPWLVGAVADSADEEVGTNPTKSSSSSLHCTNLR